MMNLGIDHVIEIIFFTSICGIIGAGIRWDFEVFLKLLFELVPKRT